MRRLPGVIFLFLGTVPPDLQAQPGSGAAADNGSVLFDPKHRLSLGITQQDVSAGIRATAGDFDPVVVKVDELGIDDGDYSYFLEYLHHVNARWALVASAYSFNETGSREVQRDFNFDGVEFEAGVALRSELDIDAYVFNVMYSVHRSGRSQVMVGAGIHALDLGTAMSATLDVNGQEAGVSPSSSTLLAPVPNLRIAGTYRLQDRLALHATGGWLSANIDEYDGSFLYGHVRAVYGLSDRLGVALGYQRTDIDITRSRALSEVNYDVRLNGFTLTVAYSF